MCDKRTYRPRYVWDFVCVWCRTKFRASRHDALYHSPRCRQAARRARLQEKSVTRRASA
jgi:hypothetical protein